MAFTDMMGYPNMALRNPVPLPGQTVPPPQTMQYGNRDYQPHAMPTHDQFYANTPQWSGLNFQEDPNIAFQSLYDWLISVGAMPHQAFINAAGKTGMPILGSPQNSIMGTLLNNPQYGYLDHMAQMNQAAAARPGPPQPTPINPSGLAPTGAGPIQHFAPPPRLSPFEGPTFQGPTPVYPPAPTAANPMTLPFNGQPMTLGGGFTRGGNVRPQSGNAPAGSPQIPFQPPPVPPGNAFQNFQQNQPQPFRGFWQY